MHVEILCNNNNNNNNKIIVEEAGFLIKYRYRDNGWVAIT
jgi:hypothetical protein